MPKVSVIVPCYNHGKYLSERLDSILNQTVTDFEVIILDDCSTDNSALVIEAYSKHNKISHIVHNQVNSGSPFVQWQKGIELAKGEYIWFAESDDFADIHFLEKHLETLDSNNGIGLSFCPSNWVNTESEIIETPSFESLPFLRYGHDIIVNEFTKGCLLYNASSAVFRKILVQNVNFEQIKAYKFTGDWLFWVQMLANTKVARIAPRFNYFRRHTENVSTKSNKQGLQFSEGYNVVKYIFKNQPVTFFQKRKINMFWALKVAENKDVKSEIALKMLPIEIIIWYYLMPIIKVFI